MPRTTFDNRPRGTSINAWGAKREMPVVTLPKLGFMAEPADDNAIRAEQIIQHRVIRAGRDAWEALSRVETVENWKQVGDALVVGKNHSMKVSGANAPWGQNYCRAFSAWCREVGFINLNSSNRSYAIALAENWGAISSWRGTLGERQRDRLRGVQQNVRKWRAATGQIHHRHCSGDLRRQATAAWRRFVAVMKLLPPGEAEQLWQQSLFEMVGQQ